MYVNNQKRKDNISVVVVSASTVICEGHTAATASVYYSARSYTLQFPAGDGDGWKSQLRFVQSDHRGGYCDCWAVTNLSVVTSSANNAVTVLFDQE